MLLCYIFTFGLIASSLAAADLAWDVSEWTPIIAPCHSCRKAKLFGVKHNAQINASPQQRKRQINFEQVIPANFYSIGTEIHGNNQKQSSEKVQLIYLPEGSLSNLRAARLAKIEPDTNKDHLRSARATPFQVHNTHFRQARQNPHVDPRIEGIRRPAVLIAQAGNEPEAREQIRLLEAALSPNQNIPKDGELPRVFIAPTHVPPPPGYIKIPLIPSQDKLSTSNLPGTFLTSDVRAQPPPGFVQLSLPESVAHLSNSIPFVDPNLHREILPQSFPQNNKFLSNQAHTTEPRTGPPNHFVVRNHQAFSLPGNQQSLQNQNFQTTFRRPESQPSTVLNRQNQQRHRFSPGHQNQNTFPNVQRVTPSSITLHGQQNSQGNLQADFIPSRNKFPGRQAFSPEVKFSLDPFETSEQNSKPSDNVQSSNQGSPLGTTHQQFQFLPFEGAIQQNVFDQGFSAPIFAHPNDARNGKAINIPQQNEESFSQPQGHVTHPSGPPRQLNSLHEDSNNSNKGNFDSDVKNRFRIPRPNQHFNVAPDIANEQPQRQANLGVKSRQPITRPFVSNLNTLLPSQTPKSVSDFTPGFKIGAPVVEPINTLHTIPFLKTAPHDESSGFGSVVGLNDQLARKQEHTNIRAFTPSILEHATISPIKIKSEQKEISGTSNFNFEPITIDVESHQRPEVNKRFPSPNLVAFSQDPPSKNQEDHTTISHFRPAITPSIWTFTPKFSPVLITTLPPTRKPIPFTAEQEISVTTIRDDPIKEVTPATRVRSPSRKRVRPSRVSSLGRRNRVRDGSLGTENQGLRSSTLGGGDAVTTKVDFTTRRRRINSRRRRPIRPVSQTIAEETKDETIPKQESTIRRKPINPSSPSIAKVIIEKINPEDTIVEEPTTKKSIFLPFSEAKLLSEKINAEAIAEANAEVNPDAPTGIQGPIPPRRRDRFGSRLRSRPRARNQLSTDPTEEKKEQVNVFPLDDTTTQEATRPRTRPRTRGRGRRRRLHSSQSTRRRTRVLNGVRPFSSIDTGTNDPIQIETDSSITGSESAFIEFSQPPENSHLNPIKKARALINKDEPKAILESSRNVLPTTEERANIKDSVHLLSFFNTKNEQQTFKGEPETNQKEDENRYVSEHVDSDISTSLHSSNTNEGSLSSHSAPLDSDIFAHTSTPDKHDEENIEVESDLEQPSSTTQSAFDSLISYVSDSTKSKDNEDSLAIERPLHDNGLSSGVDQTQDQQVLSYDEDFVDGDLNDEYIGSSAHVVYAVALNDDTKDFSQQLVTTEKVEDTTSESDPVIEMTSVSELETFEETTTTFEDFTVATDESITTDIPLISTSKPAIEETSIKYLEVAPTTVKEIIFENETIMKEVTKDDKADLKNQKKAHEETPPADFISTFFGTDKAKEAENEVKNEELEERVIGQTTITEVRSSAPVICFSEGNCVIGRGAK